MMIINDTLAGYSCGWCNCGANIIGSEIVCCFVRTGVVEDVANAAVVVVAVNV